MVNYQILFSNCYYIKIYNEYNCTRKKSELLSKYGNGNSTIYVSIHGTLHPDPMCYLVKLSLDDLYNDQNEKYNYIPKCSKCHVKNTIVAGNSSYSAYVYCYFDYCYYCEPNKKDSYKLTNNLNNPL